ncbi:DUF4384 domain-containing protein [Azospirillum isscasi]|uniref:DUF4384 domain-containing protein n=1 Tax=Azospirillum isscasi TaxID=3053926 RepID=A0ABU0WFM2_9PROT|nr:DUF4384 domain-containing protein [Azospirillum isscasi]MDQ2102409.1 DUF4384 domain-containing protein [Azospirillum isscasi]
MKDAHALRTWRLQVTAAWFAAAVAVGIMTAPNHAAAAADPGENRTPPAQPAPVTDNPPVPSTPAVPDLSALRAALSEFHCAELDVAVGKDRRVAISGLSAGDTDPDSLALLAQEFVVGQRAAVDIERASPALCEPLTLIGALRTANAGAAMPLAIRFEAPAGTPFENGQDLLFDIVAPDFPAYLQVDYFTSDGDVIHLLPNPLETNSRVAAGAVRRLGERGGGGRFWTVGPPFGHELIVVIASPAPLFASPRPEAEAAAAYLPALKQALDGAPPATLAAARFLKTRAP